MAASSARDAIYSQILIEFRAMSSELAALRTEMKAFKEAVDPFVRVVRGDGSIPAVPTTLALQAEKLRSLEEKFVALEGKFTGVADKVDKSNGEDRKGRWLLIVAIATGILGLAGSVIIAVTTYSKPHQ